MKQFINRCIVKILKNTGAAQVAQVRLHSGEVIDGLEYQEQYGFTSTAPKTNREGVALFIDGDRGNGFLISVANRQYRIKNLGDGEVALYDDKGQYVKILQDGNIKVKANTRVLAECPLFETTGNAKIGGNLEVVGNTELKQNLEVKLNTEMKGTLEVKGLISGKGGLEVSGGSGASVSGNININGGNITADGISLKTHKHGGVTAGGALTGVAQ